MLTIGSTIGAYRILDLLGEGGMGSVFLAEDTRLGRRVALKVLAPHARADEEARRRLLREARTIAGLRHPALCAVHDVIESGGFDVLVLEYVEGRTLRERLAAGPLAVGEACTLAIQVAEGLCAAHDQGIVHRDLKPGNVMVGAGGRAVVMDFGLARGAGDARLTRTGTVMGTVAYMAPEQIRGEAADHRADIWALGVLLYEMLSGRQPFAADYEQAVIYGILNREPPPLREARPEVPAAVSAIISRALDRDPARRYQSCRELLDDLRAARQPTAGGSETTTSRRIVTSRDRGRLPARGALPAAGVLLALAAGAFFLLRGAAPAVIDSLAVLPFANLSGDPDQEYIADGVTEALITELSRIGNLRVISRTSVMQYKEARQPLPEIARRLGVQAIVEGSALRVGDRLRITAQLIEAASDRHLWAEDYDRDYGDLLTLQKEVARRIAHEVRIELEPADPARAGGATNISPQILDHYLRGMQIIGGLQWPRAGEALAHFEAAAALDPRFAPAHSGVAACHLFLALAGAVPSLEALPLAREAALRALQVDPDEARAHMVLGYVGMGLDWDWERSEREFRRALELDPGDAATRHGYSDWLLVMGRSDESWREIEAGRRNDPASPVLMTVWVYHLVLGGRYEQALQEADRFQQANPQLALRAARVRALWMLGRREEVLALRRQAHSGDPEALAALERGAAAGPAGALGELASLMADRRRAGLDHEEPSMLFAAAGLADSSLAHLEALAEVRHISLFHKVADPLMAPFARHPRYEALLRRIRLPEEAIARLTSRGPAAAS